MKIKKIYMLVLILLLCQSYTIVGLSSPDYDLLIITPSEFEDELIPLKTFKDFTGRPTVIVTLEWIYSTYTGWDEAEQVKKCIADYEEDHNVKYVLLVGDVDKLPMRYFYLKRQVSTEVRWLQYYLTDHYYADLYKSGGSFCTWDDDGDHIYGEIFDDDDDGDYPNGDGIDFTFDVVVGRIPVNTGDEVERYVDKVIDYEKEVVFDSWFKNILLVTGTGDWVYPEDPETEDEDQNDIIATEMGSIGFANVKLYHTNPLGPTYPNQVNINNNLNTGAGFMNVISHGNEVSWGVYDVTTNMAGLTNQDKLTVIHSFGCSTAKVGPIAAAEPYIDVDGIYRNYGATYDSSYYPCPMASWVEPAVPNVLQDSTTDVHSMPEYWNFDSNKGAVAFVGSIAEASSAMGYPVMQYFFESFASDGNRALGDVWDSVCDKVMAGGHQVESNWDHGRRWLYINVFGDPSLVLGGLEDKPPETILSIGTPSYSGAGDAYVTGTTLFSLIASDDNTVDSTKYRYYKAGTPSWSLYSTPFNIIGTDGTYTIEFYSEDDGGNKEYPINLEQVILDTTAPTTTLTIGTPNHLENYVTSSTEFTLTANDGSGSGIEDMYYKIDSGTTTVYSVPFTISGEGSHTIYYYSIDNLGNTETEKSKTVIVDDTPPTTTLTFGIPKYMHYITSSTDIILSASDGAGSGVDDTQYRINGGTWTSYTTPFHLTDSDGSYTIDYRSVDNVGNTETYQSETVYLDNTPPSTTLTVGDPNYVDGVDTYVTSSTDITLSASDGTGSGVDYTQYKIDGGSWTTYAGPFHLTGSDGTYTVEYRSIDHLGNLETTNSEELILDNTPPEIDVLKPSDGYYVYDEILIKISATDAGSGVNHVEYSLDSGATWLPATESAIPDIWDATWDTATFPEGSHTILARAEDNVENVGYDETPPTVYVVYLEYETEFSDSNWNTIDQFDVIFNEQKPNTYKVSTNPGSIYEIITISNTGTIVTLPELILEVEIPLEADFLGPGEEAFLFQGVKSIHVYLNDVDVTPPGKWLPDLSNLDVMQELQPGDTIEVYIHYEYSFKGRKYSDPDVSSWLGEDYVFVTDIISAYGPDWSSTLIATPIIE